MKNMKNMEMKLEMEPLPPRFRLQAAKVRCYPPFTSSKEGGAVPCLALPCNQKGRPDGKLLFVKLASGREGAPGPPTHQPTNTRERFGKISANHARILSP